MAGNTIGKVFKLTTFGESHSDFVGGVIDGCPAGLTIDLDFINSEIQRRKPTQKDISTSRKEEDKLIFASGIENNISLGTPIAFFVRNENYNKEDYKDLKELFRPSHADFTYNRKYGINASSGGGRASARETLSRVVGGSIAKLFLKQKANISINAQIEKIGKWDYLTQKEEIEKAFEKINREGDSLGGTITCEINNMPVGLGEPVFDKLSADLAKAMISIPSVKAFEFGDGFKGCMEYGSEQLDNWNEDFSTKTNHSGGIQGGISNGMDVFFRVGFKPIPTLNREVSYISKDGVINEIDNKGRYDKCVLPRSIVIVESMAALTIADHLLRSYTNKI
ncbi:MAG TPA: chorismate synthase [Bacteroidales bacterium]|nr:chorismate synthase [Bacteroidales bacterium]